MNYLSLRLNDYRESLSLKVKFLEITILFQRSGQRHKMQYWLKFVSHRGSWIEFSSRSKFLVFVMWVKTLKNTEGFKICLHCYIKHKLLKIFNWKTFLRLSYHLEENLRMHINLCDKLHKQHVSGNDIHKYVNYACIVYIFMNKRKQYSCFKHC